MVTKAAALHCGLQLRVGGGGAARALKQIHVPDASGMAVRLSLPTVIGGGALCTKEVSYVFSSRCPLPQLFIFPIPRGIHRKEEVGLRRSSHLRHVCALPSTTIAVPVAFGRAAMLARTTWFVFLLLLIMPSRKVELSEDNFSALCLIA